MTGIGKFKAATLTELISFGTWRADDDPDYEHSTTKQKVISGYWTDTDGNCDPDNDDSKDSHWR